MTDFETDRLKSVGFFNFSKEGSTDGERDFVSIMNRKLPPSIIVTGWAPVKNDFSARFSCSSRHYNYIFSSEGNFFMRMFFFENNFSVFVGNL